MEKITLSIYVPCFNEENNIVNTLNNIKEGVQQISYEVLVVDDASKDKTIDMVEKFKIENPNMNIKIFRNEKNQGVGFNFYETSHKALGTYYMMIAGDNFELAGEIKKIVNNIGKADVILTYLIDTRRIFRKTLSRVYTFIINLISLNNIKYYNGPNIHLLENVKLYSGKGSGFGYSAELITAQIRERKTYVEVEISHTPQPKFQLVNPRVIPSIIGSIISIFFKQIIHVLKKILK